MAIVTFENVTRVYKSGDHEQRALDGVNLSLEEGKFVVILDLRAWENQRFSICSAGWTASRAAG